LFLRKDTDISTHVNLNLQGNELGLF